MLKGTLIKQARRCRGIMAAALMATLVIVPTATAFAAPAVQTEQVAQTQQLTLRDIFSPELYAEQNPDVVAAYGNDPEALFNHFVTCGMKEGRVFSPLFDLAAYMQQADLAAVYGDNLAGYIEHFVTFGIYEAASGQRGSAGVLFNPLTYAAAYGDVGAAYGNNIAAIVQH